MSNAAQIYLMRHGRIDQFFPHRFIGQLDLPLSLEGEKQAMRINRVLRDVSFNRVYSSPLTRSIRTACIVSGYDVHDIEVVPDFTEINLGDWEGLSVDEVRKRFPGEYEKRGADMANYRPSNGESFVDVALRSFPAFMQIVTENSGPLLIVAHAGVNRVLLSRLLQFPFKDLLQIPQDYCCLNIIKGNKNGWHVDPFGQTE